MGARVSEPPKPLLAHIPQTLLPHQDARTRPEFFVEHTLECSYLPFSVINLSFRGYRP